MYRALHIHPPTHATMSRFFTSNDLAALAQESKTAKQKMEASLLKKYAKVLFETIMHGDGQIEAECKPSSEMMEEFKANIRKNKTPYSVLWSCFTTKFALSEKFQNRDCRDEMMMIDPYTGEQTTHLNYCIATKQHRGLGIDHNISIWKVLRFTDLLRLIEGELGQNFICHHTSTHYSDRVSGQLHNQVIEVEYLPKGRTAEQEALVQTAIANHRHHVMNPEEEEAAEHAADYDY